MKVHHEFRDPVHQFIEVTNDERSIVDAKATQRLRYIAQLAFSSHVYPGATHRRFEHSLGVMHLAGQAFDVLTRDENVSEQVRSVVPELNVKDNFPYWRTVVRVAALCHDLGHPPFSHAAEHEIFPEGRTHETLSEEVIRSAEMSQLLGAMVPPIKPEVIAKLAVGPGKSAQGPFSVWESLLTEIITGDAFGVDRMDYLLRDSLHAGVAYGRFDQHRLIQTLRFLPQPEAGSEGDASEEPAIGVQQGGLHAAEGMLLARYFMFGQVYFHPVRRIYDVHLVDYLKAWLPEGIYGATLEHHLETTDNEVLAAMRSAAADPHAPGHDPARRILDRDHFKVLYARSPSDSPDVVAVEPGKAVRDWAISQYGDDNVRHVAFRKDGGQFDFPVLESTTGKVVSSLNVSEALRNLPANGGEYVFVNPAMVEDARKRFLSDRSNILSSYVTDTDDADAKLRVEGGTS